MEMDELGARKGKAGMVVLKRRAGYGMPTARLIVMTEAAYKRLARLVAERGTDAAFAEEEAIEAA